MIDKFRLHEIEGAVELFSSDPYIFRPSDLYKINGELRKELEKYNIYLIARRKRIFLRYDNLKLDLEQQRIEGTFCINLGFEIKEIPFCFFNPLPLPIVELIDLEYPFDHLGLKLIDGFPVQLGVHDVLRFSTGDFDSYTNLHVEYIGQAFGNDGDRDALDRLIGEGGKDGHGSLQKILADINASQPDNEIFVLLYSFEFYKKLSVGGGKVEPQIPMEDTPKRFKHFMEVELDRENRINLVEASLIRYFKPMYNDKYKRTFPKNSHIILEKLFELDITGLSVSLSTLDHRVSLSSEEVQPSQIHLAMYPITNEKNRLSFFDIFSAE